MDAYVIHLLILIGIYAILALSLQLALGYGGLLNIGHIAFYGIGAYTSALLSMAGYPFWFCILSAGVLASVFGFLLSIPTNRLKGDYLALSTIGFSFVAYAVMINWNTVTRGPLGIPGIPRPSIFGIGFSDNVNFLILTVVVTIFTYLFIYRIVSSPFGKVLEAIRDDTLATKSLGKNTFKVKSIALATSAFFAGIAGSLFAHYITYIDPSSFSFTQIIPILLIVMIGGLASLPGSIFASIILVLIPEPLRFIGFSSSIIGPARQIIYTIILLLILNYQPRGFFGKVDLE